MRYSRIVTVLSRRAGRMMIVYLVLIGGLAYLFVGLPSGFVPNEDQGFVIIDIQGPPQSSFNRTIESIRRVEELFKDEPAVKDVAAIQGFSFSGAGPNTALMFVSLKDWSARGKGNAASEIVDRINAKLFSLQDATAFALSPPPIEGFGNTNGFSFRLQDRSAQAQEALSEAAQKLLSSVADSKVVTGVRLEGLPDAAQVRLVINREKANAFGVTFLDINNAITANLGSTYINDYPNAGRMQRVIVQAKDRNRMQVEDVLKINVRNASGGMVPLSAFAIAQWQKGTPQIVGYNGYPTVRISGQPAPSQSSGDAISEMERKSSTLQGFGYEWSGQSLEEITSGSQAPMLFCLSILFVFLLLAGLYESWSIPGSVMLVVPLGVIGSVVAVVISGMPNDLYFKVGLIAIIGLAAKNAILIVEFAKDYWGEGRSLVDAAVDAAKVRFRPIVMTSLAFALGVLPMVIATGPSAASQNALGTSVFGGMVAATILAVFFVPAFFVFVLTWMRTKRPAVLNEVPVDSDPASV